MANTKSTQHEIDLTSGLNLNKFKADIKPYEGFNERNAPYYGGCLSPLYIKDDGEVTEYTKYVDGVKWETRDGKLYKNDEEVMSFDNRQFIKTLHTDFKNREILEFYDENNYVELANGAVTVTHIHGGEIVSHTFPTNVGTYIKSTFFGIDDNNVDYAVLFGSRSTTGGRIYGRCYYNDYTDNSLKFIEKTITGASSDVESVWGYLNDEPLLVTHKYLQINTYIYDKESNQDVWTTADWTVSTIYNSIALICGRQIKLYIKNKLDDSIVFESTVYSTDSSTSGKDLLSVLYLHGNIESWYYRLPLYFISGNGDYILEEGGNTNISQYEVGLRGGRHSIYSSPRTMTINGTTFYYLMLENAITVSNLGISSYQFNDASLLYQKKLVFKNRVVNNLPLYCSAIYNTDEAKGVCHCTSIYESDYNLLSSLSYESDEFITSCGGVWRYVGSFYKIMSDNTGNIIGISWDSGPYLRRYLGTLLTSWGSIGTKTIYSNTNGCVTYFDDDLDLYVTISLKNNQKNSFTIIGDYIVINTPDYKNCYNVITNSVQHWGSDWNNDFGLRVPGSNLYQNSSSNYAIKNVLTGPTVLLAGGQNINWTSPNKLSSKKGAPSICYKYWDNDLALYARIDTPSFDNNYVDVYVDGKYVSTTKDKNSLIEPSLIDTTYPGDAVRYNLPLLFDVQQGVLDTTIVNFGSDVGFFTIYYDNRQRYQYYSSSITEFEQFFIIQAQAYGIKDKKIYAVNYLNNVIQASQAVVSIEGLQFVGNTIYNAYFYSPTTKAIYSFGADNNLVVFAQADTFDGITGSSYLPGTSSIILGTPDCAYVLNEKFGIYRLNDIKNLRYASQKPDSVVLVLDDHAYEISYIDRDTTEDWEKIDIVCDTAFYGAGSNVVSVNDCWYVRITDPDHKAGEIKLAVSTLTDIGRSTETRTFKVKESDWDELTDTIYIRFQPKLQRAVGVSLHIESPFKIGYIGVGATPETLQLNKGTI